MAGGPNTEGPEIIFLSGDSEDTEQKKPQPQEEGGQIDDKTKKEEGVFAIDVVDVSIYG